MMIVSNKLGFVASVATIVDVLEQERSRLSDEMRASGEARRATRRPIAENYAWIGENHAWSSKMIETSAISRVDLTNRCLDAEHDALDVPIDDDHHVLGERHHRVN